MKVLILSIGLIIIVITLLAYMWSPFGTPYNIFWVPFGILGALILFYGNFSGDKK